MKFQHTFRTLAAFLAALAIAGCARDDVPRMVSAGAYRIRMLTQGRGTPAVVFVNGGFGGSLEVWDKVNPQVSQFTRTVAYNRGGTWKSDPAPAPRDSQHIADELHLALRNAGVPPPYVLVGQSIGGIHVRVFAHRYPSDTAGLVLLDPTAEDYNCEVQARNPRMWEQLEKGYQDVRSDLSKSQGASTDEYDALETDFQEARDSFPLPPVPIVLIAAIHSGAEIPDSPSAIFTGLQRDFVQRVPGARQIVAQSGHNVQGDQPALVIDTIRQVVTAARTRARQ